MLVAISFVAPVVFRVDLLDQFLASLHMSIWRHSSNRRRSKRAKLELLGHILGHVLAVVICVC